MTGHFPVRSAAIPMSCCCLESFTHYPMVMAGFTVPGPLGTESALYLLCTANVCGALASATGVPHSGWKAVFLVTAYPLWCRLNEEQGT